MEDNFRNALIILSGVVIAAIFIHGLWTIRKQKNPYKLKASKEKVKPQSRDFDGKGFDQDGVGQVKIFKQTHDPKVSSEHGLEQPISLENGHSGGGKNDEGYGDTSQEQVLKHELDLAQHSSPEKQQGVTDAKDEIILEKPVYQQPVIQAKPVTEKVVNKPPSLKIEPKPERGALKRPQMEINFDDGLALEDESIPSISIDEPKEQKKQAAQVKENKKTDNPAPDTQIIILSVVMPAHLQMSGAALLPSLLTLGMKYGEMNIFHRHQDNAGNGAVTFSLANMLNPGSFDLDTMESFVTQGVSLFMTLPNATDPFAAFEQMLSAAKQLAAEFNAQLVDDKRNLMTKQTEQHYVSKIREFDRQYRLACAE